MTKHILLPPLLLMTGAGVAWLVSPWLVPLLQQWGPPCLFRSITGLSCPGCGLTRACVALLQGDWCRAWQYNYFLPFAALSAVVEYARLTVYRLYRIPHGGWGERVWLGVLVLIVAGWMLLRNMYGC